MITWGTLVPSAHGEETRPPVAKKAVWGTGPQPESYQAEEPSEKKETVRDSRKKETFPQDFQIVFGLDYLFSAQSKNKVTGSGINLPVTTQKDQTAAAYSVEGTYHPIQNIWGISLIVENGKYAYRNSKRVSDSHLGIWIAPRIQATWESCNLWASLGLGLMKSTFKGSNYTEGAVSYALSPSEGSSYSYTIRVGLDYYVTHDKSWFVGPQLSYTEFTGKNAGLVSQGSISAPYQTSLVRSWIGLGLKVGLYF